MRLHAPPSSPLHAQRGSEHAAGLSLQLKQALEEAAALRGQQQAAGLASAVCPPVSAPSAAAAEAGGGADSVAALRVRDELARLQQVAVQRVRPETGLGSRGCGGEERPPGRVVFWVRPVIPPLWKKGIHCYYEKMQHRALVLLQN